MKTKQFYTHLIQITDITLDLGELEMSKEERLHLISLLEANIHTVVLHTVLTQLPPNEKNVFLGNLVINDHNKIWNHLKKNTINLEEKIVNAASKLISDMRKDIKDLRPKT